jgi:hypothetical protein
MGEIWWCATKTFEWHEVCVTFSMHLPDCGDALHGSVLPADYFFTFQVFLRARRAHLTETVKLGIRDLAFLQ